MKTYLSTDWIEIGGMGFSTMVKVVLTDESEAYLISVTNVNDKAEAELFKLDTRKLRKEDFFSALMDAWGEAEKLPIEKAFEMGILSQSELQMLKTELWV